MASIVLSIGVSTLVLSMASVVVFVVSKLVVASSGSTVASSIVSAYVVSDVGS